MGSYTIRVLLLVFIWVFPKILVPQNGWFIINGNPIKMDDLALPLFLETPIYDVLQMVKHRVIDGNPITCLSLSVHALLNTNNTPHGVIFLDRCLLPYQDYVVSNIMNDAQDRH